MRASDTPARAMQFFSLLAVLAAGFHVDEPCCFRIGYGAMMKPCCLTTKPASANSECGAGADGMVGGGAGWAKDCPEDANEAHQVIQEMHADTADPANVAFLHLVRRDKHH